MKRTAANSDAAQRADHSLDNRAERVRLDRRRRTHARRSAARDIAAGAPIAAVFASRSLGTSQLRIQTLPHVVEQLARLTEADKAGAGDPHTASSLAAAFRRRIAHPGSHQPLLLKTAQRDVYGCRCHCPSSSALDLVNDWYAIHAIPEVQDSEKHILSAGQFLRHPGQAALETAAYRHRRRRHRPPL